MMSPTQTGTPRAPRANRRVVLAAALGLAIVALGVGQAALEGSMKGQVVQAPRFEVDPMWPKPLPNHWVFGNVIGIGIDAQDHVFIVHRQDQLVQGAENGLEQKLSECCQPAPPVVEFDPEGNVVAAWGGPGEGYVWPQSNHGIGVDNKNNLWIGGNGAGDSHILKFTHDGKFIQQIGIPGRDPNSRSTEHFGRVAKISFDTVANEAFVADGYLHKRVAVLDMNTGAVKRFWGAYGNVPSDTTLPPYDPTRPPDKFFRTPVHCAEPTPDGLVYVCDRVNDRIQVFRKDGSFVKEKIIAPLTRGDGSVWDIAFSKDPAQKYIFLADGKNERVYVMDRQSLDILTQFGDGGRQPGQFFAVHSIATDSKGNVFTTETYEGKRIQKFVYKGISSVPKVQGTVWPKR